MDDNKSNEIVNKKNIKIFIFILMTVCFFATLFPILFYLITFQGELSHDKSEWGTFGDFIGGTVGTIFNILGALLSLISIFITYKIAIYLQNQEEKHRKEIIDREDKKNERDLEIIYKQNQPLPYLDLKRLPYETRITLCNYGIGPLIVKSWIINHNGIEYKSFNSLFQLITHQYSEENVYVLHNNSQNSIIPPNGEKILFQIKMNDNGNSNSKNEFIEFQKLWRDVFSNSYIKVVYKDIFSKEDIYTVGIKFLKN